MNKTQQRLMVKFQLFNVMTWNDITVFILKMLHYSVKLTKNKVIHVGFVRDSIQMRSKVPHI